MPKLYCSILLILCYFSTFGQINFDQLPRDLQLYPRNATNMAVIPVSGRVVTPGWNKISVQVLREGRVDQHLSQSIDPTTTNTAFQFKPQIKAEPAEYTVKVFLYRQNDSTLLAVRDRIVCGDVYVIYGQSNAAAGGGMDTHYSFNFDDKYLRNAAFSFISSTMYGEMNWYTAKQPYGSVGGIGLTLQRLILEKYGIPTCILNGAEGGAAIGLLTERDPIYHANPNTFYGRLLHRAQWANVVQQVKAIIFKQGEADAGASMTTGGQYSETLTRLFSQFREDFGDARIYVGQINILPDRNEEAAAIREVQRQVRYNFKNIESVATIGTPLGEDGVHYSAEANQQLALEQFRLIARDLYGSKDTVQIGSPYIKKVFYNTQKDSITLVFDDQMQMVWKNDTAFYSFSDGSLIVRRELKDYFFLDGLAGQITGGAAKGNRIIISLKQPAAAKKLRYMPTYFSDNLPTYYYGQTLRNTRGMRAFSFDNFPIADAIPAVTTLVARPVSGNQIQLNWNAPATATTQILERADGNHTSFKPIKTLNHNTETYTDTLANSIDTYFYRIRTFSAVSESDYSNVVSARALVLGLKPTGSSVRLYPIPLLAGQNLHIEADEGELTDVVIRDMMGRVVKSWSGSKRNGIAIPVDNVATGLYVADLQMADGQVVHRKIVIH